VGIGSLQMVLEQGDREDWFESNFILGSTIVAVLGILFFIWRELTVEHPIVDLRVFKKGNVAIGTVLSFILGLGLFASVFIYPVYVQRFLGFTAFQTGMSLLPGALASGMMMPIVGTMLQRGVSPKILIPIGFCGFFAFTQMCTYIISPVTGQDDFFYALMMRGIGLGMLFVPLTTLSLTGLQGKDIAQAAGITSMMRQLGGAFSVALVSVFSEHATQQHRLDLLANVNPYNPNAMERLTTYTNAFMARGNGNATQQAYLALDNVVNRQAMILTYKDVFLYLGVFFICCLPLVFFAKSAKNVKIDMGAAH
jgi:DHA2 family multidrug resistance protein